MLFRSIKLIRASKTKEIASEKLKKRWKLSDVQASAVLSMPLSRLVGAERLELQSQKTELEARVSFLNEIIHDQAKMDGHIIDQVELLKDFADKRRTSIVEKSEIGVEKARVAPKVTTRRVKMPNPKDLIKQEGKKLGMKRSELAEFFKSIAGKTNIKSEWKEFKENWQHNQQISTRKGRAERKILLDGLKDQAIKAGLPKRGQKSWSKFIEGRDNDKIGDIEAALKTWMVSTR